MTAEVIPELTVCFLTITGREHLMAEKWRQLGEQTMLPGRVEVDYEPPTWRTGDGAHVEHVKALVTARNRLLAKVTTPWMLTADDDDVWEPDHIETVWRRHLEVPSAGVVYPIGPWRVEGGIAWGAPPSARNPAGGPYVDQGSFGAMITEALLEVETFRHWGGWIYVDGINEDVATDIHFVHNCGIERVYTDHFTYRWERGDHLHAVDVYGPEEEAERRAKGFAERVEDHVRRSFEGSPQIRADVARWGVGDAAGELAAMHEGGTDGTGI